MERAVDKSAFLRSGQAETAAAGGRGLVNGCKTGMVKGP
jgi:hypothetical protein